MAEPRMTVIMSCYNQAQYLRQAVESVLSQKTNFPVRLVITDDNSQRDDSKEIAKEIAERHPENVVALLNEENGRYLKNILRVKAITKTEYFTLLDADDYWTDMDYLQKAVDFLDTHLDFTIYSCNVECLEEDGSRHPFNDGRHHEYDSSFQDFLDGTVSTTQTGGTVFRNVIFAHGIPAMMSDASGTDAERLFEGDFTRYLMHLQAGRAHFVNEFSGVYRILPQSLWASLPQSEKYAIGALSHLYFDEFFGGKYHDAFIWKSFAELRKSFAALRNEILDGSYVPCENRDRRITEVARRLSSSGARLKSGRCVPGVGGRICDRLLHKLAKRLAKNSHWYPRDGV